LPLINISLSLLSVIVTAAVYININPLIFAIATDFLSIIVAATLNLFILAIVTISTVIRHHHHLVIFTNILAIMTVIPIIVTVTMRVISAVVNINPIICLVALGWQG
jgi:hypothetical protein